MRLFSYLNEQTSQQIIDTLKQDCSEYLNIIQKTDSYGLFRGTKKLLKDDIQKIIPRTNRMPRDTPKQLHLLLDKLFNKRFGWKVRSESVFAAPLSQAQYYGYAYAFVPFDGFKYVWSEQINDLYDYLTKLEVISSKGVEVDLYDENVINMIQKQVIYKYTNKGLKRLLDIDQSPEIMFKCKAYYMIDQSKWIQIIMEI